jgi:hypothetical protein
MAGRLPEARRILFPIRSRNAGSPTNPEAFLDTSKDRRGMILANGNQDDQGTQFWTPLRVPCTFAGGSKPHFKRLQTVMGHSSVRDF